MCTASWVREDGGFQLFFNRDEKRTRLPAEAPRVNLQDGVQTIAPTDGDDGGSWISVNGRGVALCLLNGSHGVGGTRSRGLLVSDLAGARTADEAMEKLAAVGLERYAAFTIAVLEPGGRTSIAEWSGAALNPIAGGDARAPLASSSFDAPGVRVKRREEYVRIVGGASGDAARLLQFHESHACGADAYSPCMHRVDAETVSFSWVKVSPREVSFFYTPAAPCRRVPGRTVTIPRVA